MQGGAVTALLIILSLWFCSALVVIPYLLHISKGEVEHACFNALARERSEFRHDSSGNVVAETGSTPLIATPAAGLDAGARAEATQHPKVLVDA
jgi:hypothetical protein